MNGDIFKQYLLWFDNQMVGRQVLLLMDGFSAYHAGLNVIQADDALALRHTRVEFLPENCTSLYQPLDQGIVNSVKVHSKKQWFFFFFSLSACSRHGYGATRKVWHLYLFSYKRQRNQSY